ncbi:hypothetical protein LTR49_019584 [Elasticomyces elasticus]|nr:hypothetical protein LTR49_019584 [Elasticomyces elasticus]
MASILWLQTSSIDAGGLERTLTTPIAVLWVAMVLLTHAERMTKVEGAHWISSFNDLEHASTFGGYLADYDATLLLLPTGKSGATQSTDVPISPARLQSQNIYTYTSASVQGIPENAATTARLLYD